MISFKKVLLVSLAILGLIAGTAESKTCLLSKKEADIEIDFWGMWKPEAFAGNHFTFLNKNVPADQTFYFRHTNDYFFDLVYGKETFGYPVAEFKTSVRNRAVWGSPSNIANTLHSPVKAAGIEFGEHNHAFPRLFFWMREAWLQVGLCEFLRLGFENKHTLTVGAFPFELGRGISLGAAYAIGPGPLGFYSDAMIDQFAFGLKFSGEIVPDALNYDLYGALLQSRSNSLSETGKPIYKHEIGRREDPARGFGKDNYLIAARLLWTPFDDARGKTTFEPYVMYNNDPEQQVEFPADASSKLGTFGLAGEYINGRFECGFDTAFNRGNQFVKPWDRNRVVTENYNGQMVLVNNNVLVVSNDPLFNGLKAPDVPKSAAQKAINQSADTGNSAQNGQLIEGAQNLSSLGYIPGPLSLKNSDKRFRTGPNGDGYKNTYLGWMAVGDASYWVIKKELQVAVTGGYASGDQDPNFDLIDGNFKGFIGLQEVYAGKRVKSVFLLGTVGKVKRPGTQPENPQANKDFASTFSGFSNLGFIGSGVTWKPSNCETRFVVNPNFFAYWEPSPGKKYDAHAVKELNEQASKFLGVELNTFLSYYPFASLKCFAIGSVFFPGKHFKDIKGKPLDDAQKRLLERHKIAFDPNLIPNIGDDIAYTVNIGMEFAF